MGEARDGGGAVTDYRTNPDPKRQLEEALAGRKTTSVPQSRFAGLSKGLVRERGRMNATEALYASLLAEKQKHGEIHQYWFEAVTLRISHPETGHPARFSPDFLVLYPDGTTCFDDTKGGMVDNAAIVRIKAAAEIFPLWKFRIVTRKSKKDGGGFEIKEV